MEQPFKKQYARQLLNNIVREGQGSILYSRPHALEQMSKRGLIPIDCENVLRCGHVEEPELENGSWRHRVKTSKIIVVVTFLSEETVMIVTAWRL